MGDREPSYEWLKARVAELERELAGKIRPSAGQNHETRRTRQMGDAFVVPERFRPLFEQAQRDVGSYFEQIQFNPDRGTIEVGDQRYLLVRAPALSYHLLNALVSLYADRGEEQALSIGRNLLFDIAHIIGRNDARSFHERTGLQEPLARLAAGPLHFSHTGWARVEILPESAPSTDDDYVLIYNHPSSFEADAWLRARQRPTRPVCVMNAGYSSGWCEESYGFPLSAVEISCRALGDPTCTFVMAPPHRIEEHIARHHSHFVADPSRPHYDIPTYFDREKAHQLHEALMQSQRLEAIGTLAGGVAHDLNNILAVIMGLSSTVQVRLDRNSFLLPDIEAIASACRKGRDLTSNLLGLAHRGDPARKQISLNRSVEKVRSLLQRTLPKGIRISVDLDPDLERIEAESGQINHLLVNLALNAAHAMGPGGELLFRTRNVVLDRAATAQNHLMPGSYVRLDVIDDGAGMETEVQRRAFEAFFTTKPAGEGTGLGLTMVQSTVRAHGGQIQLESVPGRGTRVIIDLPAQGVGRDRDTTPPRGIVHPARGSGTVLLVDDEAMMRASTMRMLETLGYHTLLADNGLVALDVYREHRGEICMVILDLVMPTLDGCETFHRLKELDADVRVLLTSGYARAKSMDAMISSSVGFLQKPYDIEQLARKLSQALG